MTLTLGEQVKRMQDGRANSLSNCSLFPILPFEGSINWGACLYLKILEEHFD